MPEPVDDKWKADHVVFALGEVPVEQVPVSKACGKEDCRYWFARCGRRCFECDRWMMDFGD